VASQPLNHSNVRIYLNPIPIDGYLGRPYTLRAAADRNAHGYPYSNRAVVDGAATRKSELSGTVAEPAHVPQAVIEPSNAGRGRKYGVSERICYIR
jgi:molybdopterin biosynthesis enzyme